MYTKKQLKRLWLAGKLSAVRIGTGYNKEYRASYNRYRLFNNGEKIDHRNFSEITGHPYYSTRSNSFPMTVWGMSQEFEFKYSLASILGIPCHENQTKTFNLLTVLY